MENNFLIQKFFASPDHCQSILYVCPSSIMAPLKKAAAATSSSSTAKTRSSSSSVKKVKGENFYRDAKTVKRLKMLSGGQAVRDKDGKIVEAAAFQKGEKDATPGRVQPDRRWFGASHF